MLKAPVTTKRHVNRYAERINVAPMDVAATVAPVSLNMKPAWVGSAALKNACRIVMGKSAVTMAVAANAVNALKVRSVRSVANAAMPAPPATGSRRAVIWISRMAIYWTGN